MTANEYLQLHIGALAFEIAQLRAENETLRGRVTELEQGDPTVEVDTIVKGTEGTSHG